MYRNIDTNSPSVKQSRQTLQTPTEAAANSNAASLRLAYADPPYPGKAHLYPENTEVDHVELIAKLCEYDGWALSTDEPNLAYVLSLCPPRVRVLAWCKSDAMPHKPYPWFSWEPVICKPARVDRATVRSYFVGPAPPRGFAARGPSLTGSKSPAFCEWLIRCLGAEPGDTLDDLFPGTNVMGETWDRWRRQPTIWAGSGAQSFGGKFSRLRRIHPQLDGMPTPVAQTERKAAP